MLTWLWLLCLAVPLSCVWLGDYVFWHVTDRPHVFLVEPGVLVFQSVLAALPFVLLALAATRQPRSGLSLSRGRYLRASLAGLAVTMLFWGYAFWVGYTYWAEKKTSGADIGLGCTMCLSPAIVLLAMRVAAGRRRAEPRAP